MGVNAELIPRILRDINDGVLALDRSGHIIYMNPQSRELFQLKEEELGKTYAEVLYVYQCLTGVSCKKYDIRKQFDGKNDDAIIVM